MVYCIFGDSIVWGKFIPADKAWPILLRKHIEKKEKLSNLYSLGIDSDKSTDLIKRLQSESSSRNPDIIIFGIGTNDSAFTLTNKNTFTQISLFKKNITHIISIARKFTSQIFFLGLAKGEDSLTNPIPYSSIGRCFCRKNIENYNESIQETCLKEKVTFIQMQDYMKDIHYDDGIHPNVNGHQKIFEKVRDTLRTSI